MPGPPEVLRFGEDVLKASHACPVLVLFAADWCGPCRALTPVVARVLAGETRCAFVRVDVDANRITAARHGVLTIPTLRLYRDGQVAATYGDGASESVMRGWLEDACSLQHRPAGPEAQPLR